MSTRFYGGTEHQVRQQLFCIHDWAGPFIDEISRYYKCKTCYCLDRDCTEDEYYEILANNKKAPISEG